MKILLLVFTIATIGLNVSAQSTMVDKPQNALPQIEILHSAAFSFNETLPGDLTLENDIEAYGIGVGFMTPILKNSPLKVGANLRYMWMGGKTRDYVLEANDGSVYILESKVRGSMVPVHLVLRVDPMHYTNFPVMPYVGAFAGIRFYGSKVKLIANIPGSEPIKENSRKVSVTSSYGFEIGLHIRIFKGALLDFRYEHAYGGWAKYLDTSSIEFDNSGNATYERIESRTNVSMYTLGLVFDIF